MVDVTQPDHRDKSAINLHTIPTYIVISTYRCLKLSDFLQKIWQTIIRSFRKTRFVEQLLSKIHKSLSFTKIFMNKLSTFLVTNILFVDLKGT